MKSKPRGFFALGFILLAGAMLGASSTTQPVSHDPLTKLIAELAEKAADRSIVLVLRSDATASIDTPAAMACIREAVVRSLSDAKLNVTTSDAADAFLRDSTTAGPITAAVAGGVIAAAKTDMVMCGVVSRGNELHRIAFTLLDGHRTLAQLSVAMKASDLPAPGDDAEQATESISTDLKTAVAKCVDAAQTADVKTLLLTVRSEKAGNAGTAGFETALYDCVDRSFRQNKFEVRSPNVSVRAAVVTPAVVGEMKDAPADSAVLDVSYTRRSGGLMVKISIVSAKSQLVSASAEIDIWDAAVFPQLPIFNSRVLAYSDAQQNKKVGNGECWTLAAEALKDAKAKNANGYTFGRKLADGETILPGDIFQFTSAKFEGKNGNSTWWVILGTPHHTAVVRRVLGPTKYEILEQNPGPVKVGTIDFKNLKSGVWEAWRPESK